jgi:hypothetical protein
MPWYFTCKCTRMVSEVHDNHASPKKAWYGIAGCVHFDSENEITVMEDATDKRKLQSQSKRVVSCGYVLANEEEKATTKDEEAFRDVREDEASCK